MRPAAEVLKILMAHDMLNRGKHLSAVCPVVTQHPSWNPVCNCGHTELWEDIRWLTTKPVGC